MARPVPEAVAEQAGRTEHGRGPARYGSILAIPSTVAFLLLGRWLFARVLAPGYDASSGLGTTWFVLVAIVPGRVRVDVAGGSFAKATLAPA